MFVDPVSMKALQNILAEMETLISTPSSVPEERMQRCLELVQAARALTNDVVKRASRVQ